MSCNYSRALASSAGFVYEYHLKDHLGNTRVIFSASGLGGELDITQTDHYYPFGMNMEGLADLGSAPYKYNGKELQTDHDLNWYDYGARFYDAQIGRFHTHDRFAEKYYPMSGYQYAANNPISNIDVNGDSTLYYTHNGQLLHVSHDNKENSVVFIDKKRFDEFIGAYEWFAENSSDKTEAKKYSLDGEMFNTSSFWLGVTVIYTDCYMCIT